MKKPGSAAADPGFVVIGEEASRYSVSAERRASSAGMEVML